MRPGSPMSNRASGARHRACRKTAYKGAYRYRCWEDCRATRGKDMLKEQADHFFGPGDGLGTCCLVVLAAVFAIGAAVAVAVYRLTH